MSTKVFWFIFKKVIKVNATITLMVDLSQMRNHNQQIWFFVGFGLFEVKLRHEVRLFKTKFKTFIMNFDKFKVIILSCQEYPSII